MAIDALSRNTSITTSATRQPVESRFTQEVKQTERQEAKVPEISTRIVEAALPPIVNAQGQATGTLINIVA
jgi:hypothetical protein